MNLGNWQLDTVSGGRMRLDGGTMFGMVPKPMWEKLQPADERNRIRAATNCVLARDGDHTVLIDTGYGGKFSDRQRAHASLEAGEPMVESLAVIGVSPEDIDTVVLSHLHFDHAGGGTRSDDGENLRPTFPKARYVVHGVEWEDATGGAAELHGAYPLENLLPIEEAGQLDLIEADVEILPGLRSRVTGGHTRGHQALIFESGGQTAVYPADLCPMIAHVRQMWYTAFDTHPLQTRRYKPQLLGEAVEGNWWILWDHDPDVAASRLARDEKHEFVAVETMATL
ncbi:MAG: MBL fold metallo-hydrolase [Planctomycetes bacterium]|nr:MBL fold metallo-hydrolase [Planctomycetota bacterium]